MTRTQIVILVGLGVAIVAVFVGAYYLVLQPGLLVAPVPTLPLATVPPNPQLMTRVPLCSDVVRGALLNLGYTGEASLDPQTGTLEIRLTRHSAAEEGELPVGEIWGAFEAALAARGEGCAGYGTLVALVDGFRAQVAVADLVDWDTGILDDGGLSDRVELTH